MPFLSYLDAYDIDLEKVFLAFEAGDKQLQQHVAEIGCAIGIAVTHLVAILNVDHIVLGGPLTRFDDCLLSAIRQEMRRRFVLKTADETEISFSKLEQNIVIQGAAALILSYEMGL
jgi:predicted NBD/HSP70 family sugar kinase